MGIGTEQTPMRRIFILLIVVGACCTLLIARAKPRAAGARTQQATFAAGCFFGVEETFRRLDGVIKTTSGFTGGHVDHPTYKQVSMGGTGHVEAVRVEFEPTRISYAELLDAFWSCHDPARPRDADEPHRSIIFVHNEQQQMTANASRGEVDASGAFGQQKIATMIVAAAEFFPADEQNQQYLAKHGRSVTCSVGERPIHTRLAAEAKASRRVR
jgi:peptide-methionine (S)-S-oxide reductase